MGIIVGIRNVIGARRRKNDAHPAYRFCYDGGSKGKYDGNGRAILELNVARMGFDGGSHILYDHHSHLKLQDN